VTAWSVERVSGSPADIHSLGLPDPARRLVRRCDATSPAVVLGSTQAEPPPGGSDRRLPVVRRRSGGGAVLVEPGGVLWVDVCVPRGDPLWDDDVGRAFQWLGDAWVTALDDGGRAVAHRGALVTTRWSRDVCFAGLGPGEVTVDGRKAVGISQRRTRDGALFQCAALLAWDPAPLVARLGLPPTALDDLATAAAAVDVPADVLFDRFVGQLPM